MAICIYCLKDKEINEFNKDHVIPRAFGMFKSNFTLVESVCCDCNKYLGNELELFLGRDTLEGMLRFKYSVKNSKEFKFVKKNRIVFRLAEEGHWKNAIIYLKYSEDQKMIVANPANQVGFQKRDTGEWHFFEIKDIKSKDNLEEQGYIVKGKRTIKILFGPDVKEIDKILQELMEKGIKVEREGEENMPFVCSGKQINTEVQGTIDSIICRGIAKIAFNYLTYILRKDFVLNSSFNGIRNFIRYGVLDGFKYVIIQKEPILHFDKKLHIKQTQGHIITLDWPANSMGIFSQLTLFNDIMYRVIFCRAFDGIYRNISIGHHFNIESKKIEPLLGLQKNFWLP